MLRVSVAEEVSEDLLEAVQRLLPQLSRSAAQPTVKEVEEMVTSPATVLLVAREDEPAVLAAMSAGAEGAPDEARALTARHPDGPIVGILTLVTFRIPTGVRAWIEDVVVDTRLRGRGAGEALTRAALDIAGARGALTVDLTSRPTREAANRLYQRVGFELRQTNVYRYRLG